eukprot:CAMPEP_0169086708 /NCGR_PEP_ID=MMETSP1015-20121227/13842_1 /TAXON_ID=342587 /ORGANISM="Karlodinium micrum, Strain CCMP2283" /LENGTH=200 /DNA_ID=CAMNT_0009146889 /DNA_START=346 /DNA_END=952 /DNA_ORIENTATION=+
MEVGGGTVLRAMLRQLSTAASIRNLPTPCRAPGAGRSLGGGDITPPLGVFMGLREAVSPWSDGLGDALLEVWDLDDGFALPPPLLELGSPIGGSCEISESGGTPQPRSPSTPKEGQAFPSSDEFAKLLVERLGSQQAALLPLAAAVLAAVGVSLKPGLALALQLQAVGAGCDFDSNVGAPLLFGDIPPARPDSHQTAAKD